MSKKLRKRKCVSFPNSGMNKKSSNLIGLLDFLMCVDGENVKLFYCFFLLSITKQTILITSDIIFIIKKITNKVLGCCSIDITDQYIAPITVARQMIQKKLLFFSIVSAPYPKNFIIIITITVIIEINVDNIETITWISVLFINIPPFCYLTFA